MNGVVGGNSDLGTITAAGNYTAPARLPPVSPLTIEAVLTADPTQIATATVQVVGQSPGLIAAAPVTVGSAGALAAAAAGPVTVGVEQATGAQAAAGPVTVGVEQATDAQATSGPVTVGVTDADGAQALSGPLTVTGGPVVTKAQGFIIGAGPITYSEPTPGLINIGVGPPGFFVGRCACRIDRRG